MFSTPLGRALRRFSPHFGVFRRQTFDNRPPDDRGAHFNGHRTGRAATVDEHDDPTRVLVVGDTVPGLVLALLLERGGLAPTLVTRRLYDTTPVSAVTLLRTAAMTVDYLADADPLDGVTTPVTDLAVDYDGGQASFSAGEAARPPLRADRRRLRRRLRESIARPNRRRAQVDRIRPGEDDVQVTFGDGERATFDLVVGADGPNSFLGTVTGHARDLDGGFHEWTFRIERPPDWPGGLWESWATDALLTATPVDDGLAIRFGVHRNGTDTVLPRDLANDALASLDGLLAATVGDRLPERTSYRQLPNPTHDPTWRADRVAFCGSAAAPIGHLSGLAPSLGIEDAVDLAGALSATDAVPPALDRYADQRDERLAPVQAAACDDVESEYPPLRQRGALGRTTTLRAIGHAGLLGTATGGLPVLDCLE